MRLDWSLLHCLYCCDIVIGDLVNMALKTSKDIHSSDRTNGRGMILGAVSS